MKKNKTKSQHKMCWAPLYATKQKKRHGYGKGHLEKMKIKDAKQLVFSIFLHMNQDYVSGKIKQKGK